MDNMKFAKKEVKQTNNQEFLYILVPLLQDNTEPHLALNY